MTLQKGRKVHSIQSPKSNQVSQQDDVNSKKLPIPRFELGSLEAFNPLCIVLKIQYAKPLHHTGSFVLLSFWLLQLPKCTVQLILLISLAFSLRLLWHVL